MNIQTHFTKEQAVQFTSTKRDKRTFVGVVLSGPSGKHSFYEVRCTDGNSYKVPAAMLKPAKLTPAERKRLLAAGERFLEEREEHAAKRDQRAIRRGQEFIDFHQFSRGHIVKNLCAPGQPEVLILEVRREEGKCVVSNWKDQAHRQLLGMGFNSGKRPKATVTVYADRLLPIR